MGILGIGLLLFQVQLGNVSGIVTKPGGNEPLPEATVILSPAASTQASRIRSAVSQDDGRFTLCDIRTGRVSTPGSKLALRWRGIRTTQAQRAGRDPDHCGGPATFRSQSLDGADRRHRRAHYRKQRGAPRQCQCSGAEVCVPEGKRILAVVQTTTTDDRGEYRLFWLTAGKYVVVAGPRSAPTGTGVVGPIRPGESIRTRILSLRGMTSDALLEGSNHTRRILPDGTIQDESWMPTYYPATTDPAQATAVEVASGATVTGVDIPLGPSPVKKIRGRVTGITPGNQATVSLSSASQGMIGQILTKSASLTRRLFRDRGCPARAVLLDRAGSSGTCRALPWPSWLATGTWTIFRSHWSRQFALSVRFDRRRCLTRTIGTFHRSPSARCDLTWTILQAGPAGEPSFAKLFSSGLEVG